MDNTTIQDDSSLIVSPENPDTKWVALNKNNIIIAEGKTPEEALEKAKKTNSDFSIMFVPVEGNTYIF